jgi:DNA topoisomerase-1
MAKKLVIVESPAKAKTIARYLGRGYTVRASVGHVRDLPPKSLGVDVEAGFRATYQLSPGKKNVVDDIRHQAAEADIVYLATDPDREGEAIAWHVAQAAGLEEAQMRRVTFHQVTKAAVEEAIANPRALDLDLIDAQQARRVLDRLVGYQISPLLSSAIRKGYATRRPLSAGRVQSVALRLVVDREREIRAFIPEEYWTLDADLQRRTAEQERFRARLAKIDGENPALHSQADVDALLSALRAATWTVTKVQPGQRRRNPQPPFITSTLQAEAGRNLRLSPRNTMRIAQQLYEGIDLQGERVGLITYMRTDSPQVAPEAQAEARDYIAGRWGREYLPERPPIYRAKAALAQEAHEAIRPTSVQREPDAIRPLLTQEQYRLYDLIWRRFLASQMQPAVYNTLSVEVTAAKRFLFRASGQRLVFPGYLAVYVEGQDEAEEEEGLLPALRQGEVVDLLKLLPEQHFTEPPPRYTEPTLVKELEARGVGRPSTYASIISVIQDRGYVERDRGRLFPTDLGMIVCDALVETFADIMDVGYTAEMEDRLDEVAAGRLGYVGMLEGFYDGFSQSLQAAKGSMPEAVSRAMWAGLGEELRGRACPECGKPLQVRISDAGRFMGCTGYPECTFVLDLADPAKPQVREDEFAPGETCEKCGGRMKIISRGRGQFLGCEYYPSCKNTRPILSDKIKALAAETACPACGAKPLTPKRGRYGEYLHCEQCGKNHSLRALARGGAATETVDVACPECGARPLEKRAGRWGPYYHCPACKKNLSAKKMAAALGEADEGDAP